MDVSKNRGKTPKIDGLLWKTLLWFIMVYYGICLYMDVSKNSGENPQNGWFIMENPIMVYYGLLWDMFIYGCFQK